MKQNVFLCTLIRDIIADCKTVQGVPKKTLFLGLLAIIPLWKGQEIKVRVFLKNSGNSLSDRHQNFSI